MNGLWGCSSWTAIADLRHFDPCAVALTQYRAPTDWKNEAALRNMFAQRYDSEVIGPLGMDAGAPRNAASDHDRAPLISERGARMAGYGPPEPALPGLPHIPEQAHLVLEALHSGPFVLAHNPLDQIDGTRQEHPLDEAADDQEICALCLDDVRANDPTKAEQLEVALAEWCQAGGSQDDVLLTGAGWLCRACCHLATLDHCGHRLHEHGLRPRRGRVVRTNCTLTLHHINIIIGRRRTRHGTATSA